MRKTFLLTTLLFAASCTAFGAGGGEMPRTPMGGGNYPAPASPEEQARSAYNAGVKNVEKADEILADAARQADAKRQAKAQARARDGYSAALKKFSKAVDLNPRMHEAWNYLGYSNRKLGDYQSALVAYDRALQLKPGYPEAIEYRGHAYLGLNRLDEAKDAYLALFSSNRKLAAQLLAGMQSWVGDHRGNGNGNGTGNGNGVDGASVEAFASWVSERSGIASQTASLTREGASAAW